MRAIRRLLVLAIFVAALAPTARPASATTNIIFGMTRGDGALVAPANAWQGKTIAVQNAYLGIGMGILLANNLEEIWASGSVPLISFGVSFPPSVIAMGATNNWIDQTGTEVKNFLDGPDNVFGNGDDRRAYMRLAYEANCCHAWSPCDPTWTPRPTATDFKGMWHQFHWRWTVRAGIDNSRLQWIYNVNQSDSCPSIVTMEQLYPGDLEVDWLGIDGYTWNASDSPHDVFNPMLQRLRAMAPSKPIGINEVGVHPQATMGKSAWITSYFNWIQNNDIRMSSWFNNNKEFDWTVIGGATGDELHGTLNAWSAYRTAIASPNIIGTDLGNPRYLTDAQFRGL